MAELREALSQDFVQLALVAGLLVGCTCAYLGLFLVLKRIVFVGVALAEISAAGLALGLLLAGLSGLSASRPAWTGPFATGVSFLVTLLGIIAFWLPWSRPDVSRESLIGYAYAAAIAVATLLVAVNPAGELHELDLLSGNLLFLTGRDLVAVAVACPIVWVLHALLRKEFVLVAFDPETARTLGLPARTYDILLHLSIGVTIVLGMRLVGVLFVFASLILPAVLGLVLGRTLGRATAWAVALAALGVVLGVLASYRLDWPTGPTVVATQALLGVPVAAAVALRRG